MHYSRVDRSSAPLFCALDALAIDDRRCWAAFASSLLAALDIECMVNALQCTVPIPQPEVIVHRAAGRQTLWQCSPLAAGAQDIHDAIDHFANVDRPLVAAPLG